MGPGEGLYIRQKGIHCDMSTANSPIQSAPVAFPAPISPEGVPLGNCGGEAPRELPIFFDFF